MFPQQVLI